MNDFNNFDPNLNKGIQFSQNKSGGNKNAQPDAEQGTQAPAGDPYADQKLDPSKVLAFLSMQGGQQTGQINYMPVVKSVQAFTELFSPEQHDKLLGQFLDTVKQEAPHLSASAQSELAQNALDNYLIGSPVVQGA